MNCLLHIKLTKLKIERVEQFSPNKFGIRNPLRIVPLLEFVEMVR